MIRKIAVLVVALLGLVGCGFTTVDTGHRGIKTTFGKVQGESLTEGFYTYNPFTSDIHQMDTRIQKWDGSSTGYTRDVQQAEIKFTLTYRLDPMKAHIVYQTIGRDWAAKLIGQVVHESIKREFGQHNAVDIVSQRDAAARAIETEIIAKLLQRDIIVPAGGFQLTNIDYSDVFEHAVEAKVVAEQQAIEEKNRTSKFEELKQQAIKQAEGEAQSIRIRADALAKNKDLVEWEAVQKWDGKQCTSSCFGSASVIPLINIPSK